MFQIQWWKGEAQHNKNYDDKTITTLPKEWIRFHNQHENDTTTHYDITFKPIFKIRVIPPNKPLWLLVSYLAH
jgi:hypothetical protein